MTGLPPPLVPANVDLRDFPFMPLDVVRLRDSQLAVESTGEEFRCAVLLWCASWHQEPAGSLPDDDRALSQYAGFGRMVKEWQKIREGALRGFVKCSDGRLYHPVIAEKVRDAWIGKLKARWKRECERIKKAAQRADLKPEYPGFDEWRANMELTGSDHWSRPDTFPRDCAHLSQGTTQGHAHDVPAYVPPLSQPHKGEGEGYREGQGKGKGQGEVTATESLAADATSPAAPAGRYAADVQRVFERWQSVHEHPQAKLGGADGKRYRAIVARLKDGYTADQLCLAVDGCKRSPHHMGQNDRGEVYDDIELICRDAGHVDKFIRLAGQPDLTGLSGAGRSSVSAAQSWLSEEARNAA